MLRSSREKIRVHGAGTPEQVVGSHSVSGYSMSWWIMLRTILSPLDPIQTRLAVLSGSSGNLCGTPFPVRGVCRGPF